MGQLNQNGTGDNRPGGPTNTEVGSTGSRPISCERILREASASGRDEPLSWNHSNQARSQPSDSDRRETDNNDQAGHSRDSTAIATAFEPLNMSLETFLARLSITSERSEKSRRVFNKSGCYKNDSDGCIDTWIEVIKLHFEEEDLTERQECSAYRCFSGLVDCLAVAAANFRFVGVKSSLVKPVLCQVFIGITLNTAPVSRSPVILIFFLSVTAASYPNPSR